MCYNILSSLCDHISWCQFKELGCAVLYLTLAVQVGVTQSHWLHKCFCLCAQIHMHNMVGRPIMFFGTEYKTPRPDRHGSSLLNVKIFYSAIGDDSPKTS